MRAIVVPRAGAQDALTVMDVPIPEIDDGEVLVRIQAIGVGLHDRWFMPEDAPFPYPIGVEAAGAIAEVGAAVTRFAPGDRVMFVSAMQPKGGVWAEFASVDEQAPVPIPDELDFVRAAALPVAGGTALRAMRLLGLGTADTVFMAGASGAIGTLAIQLVRARGCRVAASASARNHEYLRSLGAERAVDYRDSGWVERVRDWRPDGVDAALAIQPDTSAASMQTVRDGGTVVTVSGDQPVPERGIEAAQVTAGADEKTEGAAEGVSDLAELAAEVASGGVHVEIERVYPFERGVEALEKTETRHARGKVIVDQP